VRGFVDVHSHVVPSGDDGAETVGEGLELCAGARRHGTCVLFATPHVWPHLPLTAEREEEIRAAHAAMAAPAREAGLELRLGFELSPAPPLLEEDLSRYRLGDLPAVLVELPFAGPLGLAERIATEAEEAGVVPVLAHPERAEAAREDPAALARFAERGWLLQVNATSLLGRHGAWPQRVGWELVRGGLASLVASDGHRSTRPPHLDEAHRLVRNAVGARADALFDGSNLPAVRAGAEADGAAELAAPVVTPPRVPGR
jgi:protein-tyrosine phosphatase